MAYGWRPTPSTRHPSRNTPSPRAASMNPDHRLARAREVPARGPDAARAAGARGPAARRRRVFKPGGARLATFAVLPLIPGGADGVTKLLVVGAEELILRTTFRRGRVPGEGLHCGVPGGPRGAQGGLAPRAGRPPRVPAAHAHERLRRRRRRRADGVLVPAAPGCRTSTKRGRLGGLRRGALAASSAARNSPGRC